MGDENLILSIHSAWGNCIVDDGNLILPVEEQCKFLYDFMMILNKIKCANEASKRYIFVSFDTKIVEKEP